MRKVQTRLLVNHSPIEEAVGGAAAACYKMSKHNFDMTPYRFGAKKQRVETEEDDKKISTPSPANGPTVSIIRREMCLYCFDVLHKQLFNQDPPPHPTTFPNHAYPLFVTWTYGKDHRLRGCIGTFKAMNLHSGLRKYAITSAMCDSRFSPITQQEFPHLSCSVSILIDFEEGQNYKDWQLDPSLMCSVGIDPSGSPLCMLLNFNLPQKCGQIYIVSTCWAIFGNKNDPFFGFEYGVSLFTLSGALHNVIYD
ncbi:unnamed protein product [Dibothriocephalus latus]|uniref:AMMECR1 domain-containing protein n=1 Tax=Dibothriocephalus latus TaxID=60516 RepID=A0A3P7LUN0_DIBLA|nr:unnamed protein product [Dibothriocephalus latus]